MCQCHQRSLDATSPDETNSSKTLSIDCCLNYFFLWKKEEYLKKQSFSTEHLRHKLKFVCFMVLYKYMKSLRIYAHNLSSNTHVRSKIYLEYDHITVHITNQGTSYYNSKLNGLMIIRRLGCIRDTDNLMKWQW